MQENHHCALTFAVLRKRGANLLAKFSDRAEYQAARRLLVDTILATDMGSHFALTQELCSHSLVFLADDDADRALLVRPLLDGGVAHTRATAAHRRCLLLVVEPLWACASWVCTHTDATS